MKFLIIDAFSESKIGRESYHEFYGIINNIVMSESGLGVRVRGGDCGQFEIIARRYDNLEDYIIDWEYSALSANAVSCSKEFDRVDMICVGGDMKLLPWNPSCYQVITLIHMCYLLEKPLLTCGSGAHLAVYTCATQGLRYQILNLEIGDTIEQLKYQPTYFKGPRAYPCGWLDNETGDIYSYDSHHNHWNPVSNIGIYRMSQIGTPTPIRYRPVTKKFVVEKRLQSHQLPVTPGDHDGLIILRKHTVKYPYFQSFTTQALSGIVLTDWQFNIDGGLPLVNGLEVLADGPNGPILFKYQQHSNSLHIACQVTNQIISNDIRTIIRAYFREMFQTICVKNSLGRSCHQFLYRDHQGGDLTEDEKLSKQPSPPLSNISIKSKIKGGPKLIPSPISEIQEGPPSAETMPIVNHDISHIIGPPKRGAPRKVDQQYRDPLRMKHTRLTQVFGACYGQIKCHELSQLAKKTLQETENSEMNKSTHQDPLRRSRNSSKKKLHSRRSPSSSPERLDSPPQPLSRSNSPTFPPPSPGQMSDAQSMADLDLQPLPITPIAPLSPCKPSEIVRQSRSNKSAPSSSGAAARYMAYNRTMIATENYRRCQTAETTSAITGVKQSHLNPAKRMNWKSDWSVVSAIEPKNSNQCQAQEFPSKPSTRQEYTLEEEAKLSFLPINHPKSRPNSVDYSHVSSTYRNTNPPQEPPVNVVKLRPQSARPYSGFKEHERVAIEQEESEYQGVFRGGYLTPYEKDRREYLDAKSKFIDGSFKTTSGVASTMPLRSPGGIQACGPYPPPIQSEKDRTKVGYYGPWVPAADLYPNQRDRSFDAMAKNKSREQLKTR